jgi:MFS family permease
VVLGFVFFLLYAIVLLAFHGFTTPTLGMLYDMPIATATTALTLFLLAGAGGMLAGGVISTRTSHHAAVASWSMLGGAAAALVLATGALSTPLATAFMMLMGFSLGVLGPSRDIIIREIAPAHSRGKVYGFIYSGLDLGGLIAPPLFGWIVDQQRPVWVFLATAALMLAAIPAIVYARRQGAAG